MTVAHDLAEFLTRTTAQDLPPQALDHAAMLIASTIASAAFGSGLESAAIIRELARERGGRPDATLWFDAGPKLPLADAAQVNAVMSDAAACDDSALRNIDHAGTPLTATTLAVAERTGAGGEDVLGSPLQSGSPTIYNVHPGRLVHKVGGMRQPSSATARFGALWPDDAAGAFLAAIERVTPWSARCALIEPYYPKPGNGRPPVGVERMLRIYFLQQWFNLSDPAVEEAIDDSQAMRFVGIDLWHEPVPDETTVCRFRDLLEAHDLGRGLFDEVQRRLAANGLQVATGTIVDATIITAPSSTKNRA